MYPHHSATVLYATVSAMLPGYLISIVAIKMHQNHPPDHPLHQCNVRRFWKEHKKQGCGTKVNARNLADTIAVKEGREEEHVKYCQVPSKQKKFIDQHEKKFQLLYTLYGS